MALNPGDIAFTKYQSDNPDIFGFVALVDIPAGEVISFTDHGWLASGGFRETEGVVTWTAPSTGLSAGTVVTFTENMPDVGTIIPTASGPGLSTFGDQITAFQGPVGMPTPIAMLHMNGAFETESNSSNTSTLPTGLVEGVSALAIDPETDNAGYSLGPTTGDRATLQAALTDPNNWTGTNDFAPVTPTVFSVTTPPQIVITEILYNADSSERTTNTQFIELHNPGSASVDLSGWTIDDEDNDGPNTVPAGKVIAAGGTLVLVDQDVSDAEFTASFPTASGAQVVQLDGDFFNLSNSPSATSEIIQLRDATGALIDEVNYDDAGDWPRDSPDGVSIYYTGPLDGRAQSANDTGTNWARSMEGTDGAIASTPGAVFGSVEIASPGVVQGGVSDPDPDPDPDPTPAVTKISAIQGTDDQNAKDGEIVTVEAVVVGDFQDGDGDPGRDLRGFYLQEESADEDGDALTSEGIFVFESGETTTDLNVGDIVRVTGRVDEFRGETQIEDVTEITVIQGATDTTDIDTLVTRAVIDLPFSGTSRTQDGDVQPDLEAFEGMLVTFADTLTITEMFQLDRFNEIKLIEGPRPQQFTQTNAPDATGFAAFQEDIGSRTITYDDGLNFQNQPIDTLDGFQGFSTASAPSMGDTIDNLSGVLSYQWAGNPASTATWRVRATEDGENTFVDANPREAAPGDVGSDYTVASLNVQNFFTTLDEFPNRFEGSGPNQLPPRGADANPRNASPAPSFRAEYDRQLEKLATTIVAMEADVVGLVELENDFAFGGASPAGAGRVIGSGVAIEELVNATNAVLGADIYEWVRPAGQTTTTSEFVGGDAIAVGFIYDTTTTDLIGDAAVLDTEAFIDPNDSTDGGRNRAALAQTFEEKETGGQFTASVNHFKSKGDSGLDANNDGIPDDPSNPDSDQFDGQGYWNSTRTEAAIELAAWLATDPTGAGDPDVMILGDLNAYAQEDPITALLGAGYTDLAQQFIGSDAYSYVFDGLTGTLDYALANEPLLAQITGVSEWNINSDEADALDYNLEFARDPAIFDGSLPFRSSDHDPILVGLELTPETTAPVAEDDMFMLAYRAVEDLDVLQNDTGDGVLTITAINGESAEVVSLASGARVALAEDGSLTYDTNGRFAYLDRGETATDQFTYTIEQDGLSDTADVTITLKGDANDYNTGSTFSFAQGTNGGVNRFGFDGDDFFISGQGVGGRPKFNDFDTFLQKAATVFDGVVEKAGKINDQALDDGKGPNNISVTANDEVTIGGSGMNGSYRIQFEDTQEAEVFKAFVERTLDLIDGHNVVAADAFDFRFDIARAEDDPLRVFYDADTRMFGTTEDGGTTQNRFDDLETFVEDIMLSLGGGQIRDGRFNDQRIADGATPSVRVSAQDDVIITGQAVGGRFAFEFEGQEQANVAADGLRTLFEEINETGALAGSEIDMM